MLICAVAVNGADATGRLRVPTAKALKAATFKVQPEYNPMARQLRLSGTVQVDVFISATGQVEKVTVVSGHALLSSGVVSALKKWKFDPLGEGDEKAMPAVTRLSFDFTP